MSYKKTREEIEELCKTIHIRNAGRYFKTMDFQNWVNDCYALHLECIKN